MPGAVGDDHDGSHFVVAEVSGYLPFERFRSAVDLEFDGDAVDEEVQAGPGLAALGLGR